MYKEQESKFKRWFSWML